MPTVDTTDMKKINTLLVQPNMHYMFKRFNRLNPFLGKFLWTSLKRPFFQQLLAHDNDSSKLYDTMKWQGK